MSPMVGRFVISKLIPNQAITQNGHEGGRKRGASLVGLEVLLQHSLVDKLPTLDSLLLFLKLAASRWQDNCMFYRR
jgi:hypothetical protein